MGFAYVRGEPEFNLAHWRGVSLHRLQWELGKCEPVCAVCERLREYRAKLAKSDPGSAEFLLVSEEAEPPETGSHLTK